MSDRTNRALRGAALLALGLAGAFLPACRRHPRGPQDDAGAYILGRSHYIAESRDEAPEVTSTAAYKANLAGIRRVAVHAPDMCEDASISGATGAAANQGQIMRTRCGVWMSEIERALAKAGYEVASWKAVSNIVKAHNATPVAAAQQLHAQVLFQLNSLERITRTPAQDSRLEREYFASDPTGAPRQRALLPPAELSTMQGLLQQAEARHVLHERLGAMLDLNAIWVANGQTVWFYRWLKVEPIGVDEHVDVLAVWRPASKRRRKAEDPGASWGPGTWSEVPPVVNVPVVGSESQAVSTGARNASAADAVYFDLVRQVVTDCVSRFSKG